MGASETKEKILQCTIQLINELGGDFDKVTIRMIAERAGVGVGLTNHYFKSKELLFSECVDTAFGDLLALFNVPGAEDKNPIELTKETALSVLEFFLKNESLATVALVNDCCQPSAENYTTRIVDSFAYCLVDKHQLADITSNTMMNEKMKTQFREHIISEQRMKAFMITATLKEAFLRRALLRETIGVDIMNEEQRVDYIEETIGMLM